MTDFLAIASATLSPPAADAELVVWAPDWSTYADSAAFTAAWTESDPDNLTTWDLNGTHRETSTAPVPHVNWGGVSFSGAYTSTMTYTVTGLIPGHTYRYRYDVYTTGETSLPPNTWVQYKDVAVVADGAGHANVVIQVDHVGGGTVGAFEAWYDRIRLIDGTAAVLPIRCAAESGRCKMTPKRTEDRAKAFDGTLMILVGAVTVRTWDVQTVPLDASEFNALLAALRATPIVTITGAWLAGATVSVWPKLGPITPISATADPQAMAFTLIEAV